MNFQINENFVCFLNCLLVALGANMAPKSFQNGAREVMKVVAKVLLFLGLEGSWGGLGASWAPRADFNRFLVDF